MNQSLLSEFVVAYALKMTVGELRERMTPGELRYWGFFLEEKHRQEEAAAAKAKADAKQTASGTTIPATLGSK